MAGATRLLYADQVTEPNVLYYGDNLDVLRRHVRDESVDLVYLDPPFNSNANYNVLFSEHGEKAAAQVQAFTDTWTWDTDARADYEEVVEQGGRVSDVMRAFYTMLGGSDMMAYLARMSLRLVELHRVLKPTGSLYLHCDPTADHYLKLLLDAVFGPVQFTNEIIWRRYGAHNDVGQGSRHFGRVHDLLLLYVKGPAPATWNQLFTPLDPAYIESTYRLVDPKTGQRFTTTPMTGPGGAAKGNPVFEWKGHTRAWRYSRETMERLETEGRLHYSKTGYVRQKLYLDESRGVPVQDVWNDIPSLSGAHKERLGYPTQKPIALMERIIATSSNPGDVVLDPFCGCGTTIDAAQALGRRWVGIDITHLAVGLIKHRLVGRYGPDIAKTYRTVGEPTTVDDARVLAREDPFQFQAWALGLVGARIATSDKKGGDKGIDGRLYFHEGDGETRQIVFSVKAGHLVPAFVRDLSGVLTREKAEIGVLISFEEPTSGMRAEAAEAGFYTSPWGKHPRIQLRTVGELLDGKAIDYPHVTGSNVTHRRAQRARVAEPERMELFAQAAEEPAPYDSDDSN